jgi:hypothetical protein
VLAGPLEAAFGGGREREAWTVEGYAKLEMEGWKELDRQGARKLESHVWHSKRMKMGLRSVLEGGRGLHCCSLPMFKRLLSTTVVSIGAAWCKRTSVSTSKQHRPLTF